ncbi:MAG: hypothetical protein JXB32_14460 [Deltaproteobacteria bacterium]|nr:hypothetical protein [Deltaproteobacteria bacterium]
MRKPKAGDPTWLSPFLAAYVEQLHEAFPASTATVASIAKADIGALVRHLGGPAKAPSVEAFRADLRTWAATLGPRDGERGFVRLRNFIAWATGQVLTGGARSGRSQPIRRGYSDTAWQGARTGLVPMEGR